MKTQEYKIRDCYTMADLILKPKKVDDPLAVVCLAELLYNWKYDKTFTYGNEGRSNQKIGGSSEQLQSGTN